MSETTRWRLPLLAAGQAQKEVTHNAAIAAIDRLLHLAVASRRCGTPPAPAMAGEMHIVAAGARGEWAGLDDRVVAFDGFGWTAVAVRCGCLVWVVDEAAYVVFDGNGWKEAVLPATAKAAEPAGQPMVDDECRAMVAALMSTLRGSGIIA